MLADLRTWHITVPISGNFSIRSNVKETDKLFISFHVPPIVAHYVAKSWVPRGEEHARIYIASTGHINVSRQALVNCVPCAESLFQVPKIDYAQDSNAEGAGLTRRMSDLARGLPLGKQLIQNHGHNLCKLLYRQDGSAGQKALTKCCHVYAWAVSALLLIFLSSSSVFVSAFDSVFLCWFSPIAFIPSIPGPHWIELSLYTCRIYTNKYCHSLHCLLDKVWHFQSRLKSVYTMSDFAAIVSDKSW